MVGDDGVEALADADGLEGRSSRGRVVHACYSRL
jgi:hypothetical protein